MSRPTDRPSKICPVCERPFTWRKKWRRVWHEVVYCSKKCRGRRGSKLPESRRQ